MGVHRRNNKKTQSDKKSETAQAHTQPLQHDKPYPQQIVHVETEVPSFGFDFCDSAWEKAKPLKIKLSRTIEHRIPINHCCLDARETRYITLNAQSENGVTGQLFIDLMFPVQPESGDINKMIRLFQIIRRPRIRRLFIIRPRTRLPRPKQLLIRR